MNKMKKKLPFLCLILSNNYYIYTIGTVNNLNPITEIKYLEDVSRYIQNCIYLYIIITYILMPKHNIRYHRQEPVPIGSYWVSNFPPSPKYMKTQCNMADFYNFSLKFPL